MSERQLQLVGSTEVLSAGEDEQEKAEERAVLQPRIYVASLSDYQVGRLHGAWLNADRPVAELEQRAEEVVRSSSMPNAKGWGIYDYADFGRLRIGKLKLLATVQQLASGLRKHGESFGAFAEWVGVDEATEEAFDEQFLGEYESVEKYAEDLLLGLGGSDWAAIQGWLRPYIKLDVPTFARDLVNKGEIHTSKAPNGVWIFQYIERKAA